jgi:hypothetical protein
MYDLGSEDILQSGRIPLIDYLFMPGPHEGDVLGFRRHRTVRLCPTRAGTLSRHRAGRAGVAESKGQRKPEQASHHAAKQSTQ